jgi:hypothetical protein
LRTIHRAVTQIEDQAIRLHKDEIIIAGIGAAYTIPQLHNE